MTRTVSCMPATETSARATGATQIEPLVLRLPAAGVALSLSRRKVHDLIAEGELEAVPVGGVRMVTVESIKAYVERQKLVSTAA